MHLLSSFVKVFLVALLYGSFSSPADAQNKQEKVYVIKAGKLYDSEKNVFLEKQEILIKDGKIAEVGLKVNKAGAQIIDATNCTVTPGLIDAHTHVLFSQKPGEHLENDVLLTTNNARVLRAAGVVRSYLLNGFTAIRDLGNSGNFLDVDLSRAIDEGWIVGPRMYVSGPILSPEGGQFFGISYQNRDLISKEYRVVKGVDDAKSAVREHLVMGVDCIKICAHNDYLSFSREELKAIVDAAHQVNLKVTAHANSDGIIREAILAGVDGIEHGYSVSDSTLTLMSEKGVYLVPTDGSFEGYKQVFSVNHYAITDTDIKGFVQSVADRLKRAYARGVTIVAGSDMYIHNTKPIGEVAKDVLVSYYEAGIPANDVLHFATYNGAKALNREGVLGVLKQGAPADITIFNGDLETNFKQSLYNIRLVFKAGVMHTDQPFALD
jgi:imidazolonepropionase-like amidohydrolase